MGLACPTLRRVRLARARAVRRCLSRALSGRNLPVKAAAWGGRAATEAPRVRAARAVRLAGWDRVRREVLGVPLVPVVRAPTGPQADRVEKEARVARAVRAQAAEPDRVDPRAAVVPVELQDLRSMWGIGRRVMVRQRSG